MNRHQQAAIADAAALVNRAATGDHAGTWALADDVAQSEHVREAIVVLAQNAATYLAAVADLRLCSVGDVLGQVAAFHAAIITNEGD